MSLSCIGSWRVLSLMAGSSADGVSAALVLYRHFWPSSLRQGEGPTAKAWDYIILEAETLPYPPFLIDNLHKSLTLSGYELLQLSIVYTDWTGEVIQRRFRRRVYDLLVWHPPNIFHEPSQGLTWSLGDPERLRVQLGKPIVTHLRARDIASGGTGAPLIPNADACLFAEYGTLLNLGGIANLTHLPNPIAYDITPCNQLLNALASQANPTLTYDPEGTLARQGRFISELKAVFHHHPFFSLSAPKSLDNQTVRRDFIVPFLSHSAEPVDKLHTATQLIAEELTKALRSVGAKRFTCTGGGTHNRFLIEVLQAKTAEEGIEYLPAPPLVVDYRESVGFGLLGLWRYLDEDNTHGKWTGARRAHSSGLLSL
ncbi:MAG: anhydro-N-acetylmuramic acid kinase [Bacteroidia bacterium]|nr:anhydro-N-acetylmuramic acid kinase [Bacteroidia bacterium]